MVPTIETHCPGKVYKENLSWFLHKCFSIKNKIVREHFWWIKFVNFFIKNDIMTSASFLPLPTIWPVQLQIDIIHHCWQVALAYHYQVQERHEFIWSTISKATQSTQHCFLFDCFFVTLIHTLKTNIKSLPGNNLDQLSWNGNMLASNLLSTGNPEIAPNVFWFFY